VSSAQYRLVGANGAVLESGSADVSVAGGVLELQPAGGAALRVPSGRIASVAEPEPFTVLVTLADGSALELARLGRMRTQLLEELRDAQAGAAAVESGAVGSGLRFSATVAASAADLHVFEDALLVLAGGRTARIAFSFVADVRARDYTVSIDVAGQDTLAVTGLGRRCDEFAALLGERLREARTRTSAFLGGLLPGLDPMSLRAAAARLRDGVAVPVRELDAIHPQVSASLLRVATLPDRFTAVAGLADRADLAIGFRQASSVRRSAVGVTPWHDPSAMPHIGQHDSPGGLFMPGFGGAMAASALGGVGPMGGMGGYWAFRALGAGLNWNQGGGQPAMTPRADVRHGLLIPETQDLAALTATGANPTILAFALICPSGHGDPVAYVVLNRPDPATYVYQAGGPDPRALVNRALDDAGFSAAAIHAATSGDPSSPHRRDAESSPLARALLTTVPHDASWPARLAELMAR
jgi:hypothetical protein